MATELRCESRLHAVLTDNGLIEIKCRYDKCGASADTTVLHYFDPITGNLVETKKFRDPSKLFKKEEERV